MLHTLIIKKLVPWSDYNEYEGEIEGVLDKHDVCCYVLMSSEEEWQTYTSGDNITVGLWLERNGSVTLMKPPTSMALRQVAGVNYEVTGTVTSILEETVLLDSVLPLRVDLDISPDTQHLIPEIHLGDQICVAGILKVDLNPGEE
jgi:hypothetical protein